MPGCRETSVEGCTRRSLPSSSESSPTAARTWSRSWPTTMAKRRWPTRRSAALIEAGRKSVDRYALIEAHRFLGHGHALLADRERSADQDRTLIDLVNTWSFVHYYRGTIDEWVALLQSPP